MPLTEEGYQALRAADYLTTMQDDYEANTGLDVDWDYDIYLANIFIVTADRLGALNEGLQAVADARDPNNATGNNLAILASITGANRDIATFGTVAVDLGGTAATVVPGGSTVFEDVNGIRWALRDSATLPAVGVTCDCLTAGAIAAAPTEVSKIVTPVFGLDSVTNPAAAIPGDNREADDELRVRRLQTLQLAGSTAAAALQAELLVIDGIDSALVLENATEVDVVIEGVSVLAHTMAPIVHPPTIPDSVKFELADAIYRTVAGGINTSGSETAQVQGGDLAPKTVRYSLSSTVTTDVTFDVIRETGFDVPTIDEIRDELQALVPQFFATNQNLGGDVLVIDMVCLAQPVAGVRSVTVTLATDPVDPTRIDAGGNVTIFANEIASPGLVTVNEVV